MKRENYLVFTEWFWDAGQFCGELDHEKLVMEDEPGRHPGGHQQEVPHDGQRGEDAGIYNNIFKLKYQHLYK